MKVQYLPKLRLSLKRDEALRASRVAIGNNKLVYVLIADKRLKYETGKSRIAYIGTTKKGVARIAQSAGGRAEAILGLYGVRTFHVRVITCKARQNVKTWFKLERAMLLCFRDRFGEIPECNTQGSKMKEKDEFQYFSKTAVRNIIEELS